MRAPPHQERWTERGSIGYGLAVVGTGLAAGLRYVLGLSFPELPPFITFYAFVVLSALVGGAGAGLLATALSAVAVTVFFLGPGANLHEVIPDEWLGLAVFCAINVVMSIVSGRVRTARRRVQAEAQAARIAEKALRESEQRLRATYDHAGVGIVEFSGDDQTVAVNDRICQMLGWSRAELLALNVHELTHPEDRARSDRLNADVHAGRLRRITYQKRYLKRDGLPLWVEVTVTAVRDAQGRWLRSIATVADISQRRVAEEALHIRMAAIDAAADMVVITDRTGTIQYVNPAFTASTGYSAEEAIGQNPRVLKSGVHGEEFYRDLWQTILAGRTWHGELVNRRKDGTFYTEDMIIAPVSGPDGRITNFIAIKRDVTERKRAEQALRQNEAQLAEMIRLSPSFMCVLRGPMHVVTLANERFFDLVGCSDITGKPLLEALPGIADQLFPRLLDHVLRIGHPFVGKEMRVRLGRASGAPHEAWVDFVYLPLRDPDGSVSGVFVHGVDITERKRHEEELLAAQRSAERAKADAEKASRAKDHFLAVLSHELRTPLTPVLATIRMLQRRPALDQDLRDDLEVMRRNIELEARLIDDLLDLTRIARGKVVLERRRVDLRDVIQRAVEVCQPDLEARQLHFGMGGAPPSPIEGDAARLQQVFWNLLKNAIKFTPTDGRIGIRCWHENGQVITEVQDSGVGIAPEALHRIFNAFEQEERSTKYRAGGLGLGLTISRTLVEKHGGTISGHSAGTGKGAAFLVRLPLAGASATETRNAAPGENVGAEKKAKRRILLVEDHGDTARILVRVLESGGHDVHVAGDVATALGEAAQYPFDLLISDLGLPDGSGLDLMRELRARGWHHPAIALTGLGQQEDVQRSHDAGFSAHLTKPIDCDQIERAVAGIS